MNMRPLVPCLLTLMLVACSATQKVEELSAEYEKYYKEIPDYESLPVRRISWQEALDRVEKSNLEYREQQRQYENSKFQTKRTLRSLIPLLDAGYYYNAPLRWGEGYPAERNFNINIFFNLPQLVQLPVDHYTDALALIKADTDLRLKKRELEAQLYQCFREYDLLRREQRLQNELHEENEDKRRAQKRLFEEKKRRTWSKLCKLLNDHSARWEPRNEGLPTIRLKDYRERLKAPDKLFLANIALMAEAARLQKLGVVVRFMPTAHLNFYSPSLFTSSGGNTDGFMRNADDVRVNFNTYISFDTRLEMYHDYKDAKLGEELTKEQLKLAMHEHREKVHTVLNSWEQYEKWRLSLHEYVAFRNTQGVTGFEEAQARHEESLDIERARLEQERANLERECAIIQEYGWRAENN